MRKFLFFGVLALFAVLQHAVAQTKTVTGKVTDQESGIGLPGVAVIVKGTSVGTATGGDGSYSINVPADGNTLVFRFIGYQTTERAVNNQGIVNVSLSVDNKQLEEVVVVAYGTADKGSFVGSAGELKVEKLAQRPVTNISNAVAGQIAGVQTTAGSGQPGSGPSIRIRGISSVNASNDPLYVVDGVPYSGTLANLNIEDVENITVLKDASSTSLYGSRAANGVVMVTTKKGKKDRNQIDVKALQGVVTRAVPEYDRVNAYEYYPLMWESYRNSLAYNGTKPIPLEDANKIASGLYPRYTSGTNNGKQNYNGTAYNDISQQLLYNPFNVPSTEIVLPDGTLNPNAKLIYSDEDLDWFAPLSRTGSRKDYALSFSGGAEKSDYYVSLGYVNEAGFVKRSDYDRITGRVNVNATPKSWLRTGLNLSGTITESNQANDGSSTGYVNPFYFARNMGPIFPVYAQKPQTGEYILDAYGNKIYDLGNMNQLGLPNRPAGASAGRHVVAETELNNNLFRRNVLSGRTYGEITFLKDFKFNTGISVDISNYVGSTYDNTLVGDGAPAGRASKTQSTTTSYTFNQLLTYNKRIADKHNIDVLFGHENYSWEYNYLYGFRQGQVVAGNTELGNFTDVNSLTSRTDRHKIESYFSRLNYNFDERYSFSASYRRDGSSKFAPDVRWGDFWSVGASWRVDNETFINMPEWVDMLKVRTSYGQVGNDGIDGYYPYQGLYGSGPGYNNGSEPGFLKTNIISPDLTWESSNSFDVGVDFSIFKRLNGSVEYFQRESSRLLFEVPLPVSSGSLVRNQNIGTMWNKGFEVQLSADVLKKNDFEWNVDFNWTTFKNQITKLPNGDQISGTKKLSEGKDMYAYWLREWYGVDPDNGNPLYRADTYNESNSKILANGDTVTFNVNNARFHYAGSAIPDFTGGITNTFTYKDLSLSVLLTYQVGGKIYDNSYASLMAVGGYGSAFHSDILNRWQKPGDITDVPRLDQVNTANFNAGTSDRWLVDGSSLTIRTATLNYNLPKSLSSKMFVQNARIYASGENLHIFAARKGMNGAQQFNGVTSNTYTPARVLSLGLNLTL